MSFGDVQSVSASIRINTEGKSLINKSGLGPVNDVLNDITH